MLYRLATKPSTLWRKGVKPEGGEERYHGDVRKKLSGSGAQEQIKPRKR